MNRDFAKLLFNAHKHCPKCPAPYKIAEFFEEILGTLFPDYSKKVFGTVKEMELHLLQKKLELEQLLFRNPQTDKDFAEAIAEQFFDKLPEIRERLEEDITAIYEGDPAAKSRAEVTRSYLGFYATAAYRIAHQLHLLGVEVIPRIIAEYAHSKTGVDINPAATIGRFLCIDHGTGIVIGETVNIGNHVKIYQGVTLGALSVDKKDAGIKRHPTIEDHVIIYAGATILGGETVVGHHSVIGGNVWLTKSVPANSKVYYQAKMTHNITGETDLLIYK